MLELSALENQKILKSIEQISVSILFQTVYESKRVILKKSTGLGLNFVREVATLHNGKIELKNLPEKGVRATRMLPKL
jgi:two-component system sensor histidine kinase CreC